LARAEPHRYRLGIKRKIFQKIRETVIAVQIGFYRKMMGMDIGQNVRISLRARLDFTYPQGIHIGDGALIAFDAVIFAHDQSRLLFTDTYIGKNCFIGAQSIIMPGVRIGDCCIVGSGSVVTRDVPSGSIVAGNPAKVIRSGIRTIATGILEDVYRDRIAAEAAERNAEPAY
jgi:acetyltransferase-like isoleucine patch superfamily enzyme